MAHGVEEPTPTLLLLPTMKLVAVEEPTTNCGLVPSALPLTERSPHGDVVPTPTAPLDPAKYAEPLEVTAVEDANRNVEESVEVEVMLPAMNMLPCTARAVVGVEVPIPTKPLFVIVKRVEVE